MVNLKKFQAYVKEKSPAFVPLFQDRSRYQVAYGGAGCVHPETRIHTEFGLMRICDVDRPMRVLSWNASSQRFQLSLSGGSFPKGRANLYRVTTERGVFESSAHHQILLSSGEYRRVDSLHVGDEINQALPCHDETIEEYCRELSHASGMRYHQTVVDYLGDYAALCRQYDPLPHEHGDYAIFSEPSLIGAQVCGRSRLPSQYIDVGRLPTHTHPCLRCGHHYRSDCDDSALRFECDAASRTATSSFECISHSRRKSPQSLMTTLCHRKDSLCAGIEREPLDFSVDSLFDSPCDDYIVLSGASRILSIDVVGESEYWCMQVLNTNNYVSEDGTIHHNSGKSHIVARKLLYRIINEDHVKHNFLILRKVDKTVKKSVWRLMRDLIIKWGLYDQFDINITDRTMIYKPTQSQFMFSGLDDVEKLKSIEGVTGVWMEEATEFLQEDFEQVDLRLRGNHGCLLQLILTFNPVSDQHWLKRVFFDDPISGVFTLKTTFLDNAFIDDAYKLVMENKKKSNPRYYQIYALGNWGTAEGLVFNRVSYRHIDREEMKGLTLVQGLDFGYTNDPTAFNQTYIDKANKKIYVFDGFYEQGMSNDAITASIKEMKAHKHLTVADSSEPKSIDNIASQGVKITGAKKGADSINAGLDFLLDYEIIVNAHLVDFRKEFENYSWGVDKNGKATNKPIDDFNHLIDSLRYATESEWQPKKVIKRPKVGFGYR